MHGATPGTQDWIKVARKKTGQRRFEPLNFKSSYHSDITGSKSVAQYGLQLRIQMSKA
jgi:hypothetical protein